MSKVEKKTWNVLFLVHIIITNIETLTVANKKNHSILVIILRVSFFSVFLLVFLFVRENFRPMKTESSYFIPVKFSRFVLSGDKETKTSRKHHSRTTDYHDK